MNKNIFITHRKTENMSTTGEWNYVPCETAAIVAALKRAGVFCGVDTQYHKSVVNRHDITSAAIHRTSFGGSGPVDRGAIWQTWWWTVQMQSHARYYTRPLVFCTCNVLSAFTQIFTVFAWYNTLFLNQTGPNNEYDIASPIHNIY